MTELENKTVALVGNASLEAKEGDYIDSFDYVVRVNLGHTTAQEHPETVGARTDFLVHCVGLFKAFPDEVFPEWIQLMQVNKRLRRKFYNRLGGSPTTGLMALVMICRMKPAKVYVTGISFYEKPYQNGYHHEQSDYYQDRINDFFEDRQSHKHFSELAMFEKVYRKYKKLIILDAFLNEKAKQLKI